MGLLAVRQGLPVPKGNRLQVPLVIRSGTFILSRVCQAALTTGTPEPLHPRGLPEGIRRPGSWLFYAANSSPRASLNSFCVHFCRSFAH